MSSAHVVCLVFEHVATLRDHIIRLRPDKPIVVVGDQINLSRRDEEKIIAELAVKCNWENVFVNIDVEKVFFSSK